MTRASGVMLQSALLALKQEPKYFLEEITGIRSQVRFYFCKNDEIVSGDSN